MAKAPSASKKLKSGESAVVKAPKQPKGRVRRILKKKEPLLVENTKKALVFKGIHTSQCITEVLKDISQLLKPNARVLNRKNEIFPFENANL